MRHAETDMRVASLFLKRTLNDPRGTWVLLRSGYTSQAATVAASLWENSMVVACVAGHPDRAKRTTGHPEGDLPWTPKKAAQPLAADHVSPGLGRVPSSDEYEQRWCEHYGPYKWFCKIKHPTLKSTSHDAFSARKDDDTYLVMAIPDLRPDDLGMKLAVGTASLNRALSGVRAFISAAGYPRDSDEYGSWANRWKKASELTIKIMTYGKRPVLTLDGGASVPRE